ncbi:TOX high mobility group box family member 2 isoform X1 [Panthera pardus]|uniref:TOX high mobility group box family member 2 isoform X1 n=2 Tax=Panthera pardus TaxID=9691 RepID=A0A9V1G2G6_PANPR|nr:TOX high mobility group box family member 2 isoform X1 [Panthera pardus]XP_049506723.1 TOX high mobility group box family member 2 isoform X4 [Panthera uncia]XP_058541668.1 TOX high mobility group box family member 2 isoform X1 [Neofelis nebulosa]XP_060474334.1 TOX high mobility group box family member 2 isoform X1 [Panthera onca]
MQQNRTEAVAGAFSRCQGFCGMRLGLLLLGRRWCIAGVFQQKFDGDSAYVGMSDGNPELLSTSQTYNSQSESNEDYEIPPITPPNLPEPSLLHLGDHEAGYHSLCHGLTPNGLLPAYSYQAMDLPAIMVSNMLAQDSHLLSGQLPTIQEMVHSEVAAYDSGRPGPLLGRPAMLASHMSALSQSQLISQMGIRSGIAHSSPSPPGSKSATPSPSSSTQEEESEAHFKMSGEKRPSADPGKKTKNPKKKKKKDPNEPQKPVSAYALFFRDTQAAIKGQNPSATFGDVSKIVASMWDSLGEEQKQAYKRKTEAAKKEYLKALAAYRASLVSKSSPDQGETKGTQANPPAKMLPPKQPLYAMPGLASFLTPSDLQAFRSGASPASLARTLGSKSLLPGLSASPPPPPSFPLSPPLHQQLPLPPHAQGALLSPPVSMSPAPQAPVLPTPMALQVQLAMSPSPPGPQDFPHISEFPSGSGSRSPGPSNPPSSSGDWDSSYPSTECGVSTCSLLPRDKSLYLT